MEMKNTINTNNLSVLSQDFEDLNNQVNEIIDTAGLEEDQREDLLTQFEELLGKIAKKNDKGIMNLIGLTGETTSTILQKLCQEELIDFVRVLLNYNVDPSQITEKNSISPILECAIRCNVDIMKLLIEKRANISDAIKSKTNETVLHLLLKKNTDDAIKIREIEKCLELLLGSRQFKDESTNEWLRDQICKIVNKRNAFGDTPMYHATQKWPGAIVLSLLKHGAKVGMKRGHESVVNWIPTATFEEYLDESCLQTNYNTGEVEEGSKQIDLGHPDLKIWYDYSFLEPSKEDYTDSYLKKYSSNSSSEDYMCCLSREDDDQDPEGRSLQGLDASNHPSSTSLPETEPLWHLAQSKDHSKLLKHPVISSFLWLKWIRIRRYYNRNLRFSALFTFVLTWYILYGLGEDANFSHTNLFKISYGTFLVVMSIWIMNDTIDIFRSSRLEGQKEALRQIPDSPSNNVFQKHFAEIVLNIIESLVLILFMVLLLMFGEKSLYYGVVALLSLMVLRESLQAMVSITRYLLSVVTIGENFVEVSIITLVIILLFPVNFDLKRHIAAFTIVLSWGELITLIGKHPRNNSFNTVLQLSSSQQNTTKQH